MRRVSIASAILMGLGIGGAITQNRVAGPRATRRRDRGYSASGCGERERTRRIRQIASGMLRPESRGAA